MGSTAGTHPWQAVVDWSAGRFDVVSASELAALGVAPSQVKSWVRTGRLHRLHDRVWAVGRASPRPEGRWRAAVIASGPVTVLSHHTAGLAHELAVPPHTLVHVTTTTRARSGGGRAVHRAHGFDARDLTTRLAISTTALERTLVDLADVLTYPELRHVFDRLRRLDAGRLEAARARAGKRRGSPKLTHLIERDEPHTRSELERRFLRFARHHAIRRPDRLNARLGASEMDARYDAERVVVELDGRAFHRRGDQMRADRRRDAALHLAGWIPHRIVWEDLNPFDAPATAATLATLLSSRAAPRA